MQVQRINSLHSIDLADLRTLANADYPFTDAEFLLALEDSGSVGGRSGWQPAHLIARNPSGEIAGLLLSYVKGHSYGEYVFDWQWAQFYQDHGVAYYPKFLAAVPFTPATGPRLLLAPGCQQQDVRATLVAAAVQTVQTAGMQSCHALFLTPEDLDAFSAVGFMTRHSCQYHWVNNHYRDFADFLDALIGKRRRDIVRERRRSLEHGLELTALTGAQLTPAHAAAMEELYLNTTAKKNAIPYLRSGFFARLFASMPDRILLIAASKDGEMVAGALNFFKGKNLYGRYWGCRDAFQDLHFELCYYRTIDYAIAHGLTRFEAGAQGEHKIQRGFMPSLTLSAHFILDASLRVPIARYIAEEQLAVAAEMADLARHGPFRAT